MQRALSRAKVGRSDALFLGAAICWGASWPGAKLLTARLAPAELVFGTLLGSMIFIGAANTCVRRPRLNVSQRRSSILLGILEPGLASLLFMGGLSLTSASLSSLVDSLQGPLSAFFAAIFLREKGSPSTRFFLALATIGILIALYPSPGVADFPRTLLGTTLLFGGVVAASIYVVVARKTAQTGDASQITWYQSLGGVCLVGVFQAALRHGDMRLLFCSTDPGELLALFALGILANALPFWSFTSGLSSGSALKGALYLTLIPVVATLLSAFALHERLSHWHYAGMMVTLACVFLGVRQTGESKASARSAKPGKA